MSQLRTHSIGVIPVNVAFDYTVTKTLLGLTGVHPRVLGALILQLTPKVTDLAKEKRMRTAKGKKWSRVEE
jgi:hypothetical protein